MQNSIIKYLQNADYRSIDLKSILFDMDGVLFDSMPGHAYAWVRAMRDLGVEFEAQDAYLNEGRTGEGTIQIYFERDFHRLATEQEIAAIYQSKVGYYEQYPEAMPMVGALELLELIRSQGVIPTLVTGSGQRSQIEKIHHCFPSIFSEDRMVTAFDVTHGKPHPEPFLKGLEKAHVRADQAIVIENAPMGIQAAKAAGLFTIAINSGPLSDQILLEAGADLLLSSMQELLSHWQELRRLLQTTALERNITQ